MRKAEDENLLHGPFALFWHTSYYMYWTICPTTVEFWIPFLDHFSPPQAGWTPLHVAAFMGRQDAVKVELPAERRGW